MIEGTLREKVHIGEHIRKEGAHTKREGSLGEEVIMRVGALREGAH
jgi:hypothetical protein